MDIWTFLIVCPLVGLAGFIDAIAGGGGLISLPAYLIAGLPPHAAIGTNKFGSCCGTVVATWQFARHGFIRWKQAVPAVALALVGSWLGARLALMVDPGTFKIIMLIILPLTGVYVLNKKALQASNPPYSVRRTMLIVALLSFVIGVYDGFYGPGTGTFLLLCFCNFAKMDLRTASGNVKVVNFSSNIGALATSLMAGKVLVPVGLIAAVFSIAGHYIGAGLTIKNGAKIVRPVILVVLALLAVKVVLELVGV